LPAELEDIFVSNLATAISLVLTWHKDKRRTLGPIEGKKKLTMQSPRAPKTTIEEFSPRIRSRINGPLAGILASCEYLKESHPDIQNEVSRFLNVIERNAQKIHEITAGIGVDK